MQETTQTTLKGEDNVLRLGTDTYLNPYLRPASEAMSRIISYAISDVLRLETRRRRRTDAQMETFREIVAGVICAAAHHELTGARGWLFTTRSNDQLASKGRYKSPLHSKQYPAVLDKLAEGGGAWIEQRKGVRTPASNAPATTIRASKRLKMYLEDRDITVEDIRRVKGGETIILKAPKRHSGTEAKIIDYDDTPQTIAWREELAEINAFLEDADIIADVPDGDDRDRTLRRTFNNGLWYHGGRLSGGFWIPMSKTDRFELIEVQGESIAELDFCQMSLAVAYALSGAPLPDGDLYLLEDLKPYWSPSVRSKVKQYVNAMLHQKSELKRRPTEIKPITYSHDGIDSREIGARAVREMILEKHSAISEWFECNRGMELMFHESEIIIRVVRKLMEQDVVSLPIHDAILVPASKTSVAHQLMKDAFREVTGGDVSIEVSYRY